MAETCDAWESIVWRPSAVTDGDLVMFLRAARSMAAFVGMCDGGSTEDGCAAALMDATTANALEILHQSGYDTGKALQLLVKTVNPKSLDKNWIEEDAKKFVKGLRQHGKNFFKIRAELLPEKQTSELVEYYYFWKKTPSALSARPHRRHRRGNSRRQISTPQPHSSEGGDLSSASDIDESENSDDSEILDPLNPVCVNCCTKESSDWHTAADRESGVLCSECHWYQSKYTTNRPVSDLDCNDRPGFLFKPIREESPEGTKQRLLPVRKDSAVGAKRNLPSGGSIQRSSSSASSSSDSSSSSEQPPHTSGLSKGVLSDHQNCEDETDSSGESSSEEEGDTGSADDERPLNGTGEVSDNNQDDAASSSDSESNDEASDTEIKPQTSIRIQPVRPLTGNDLKVSDQLPTPISVGCSPSLLQAPRWPIDVIEIKPTENFRDNVGKIMDNIRDNVNKASDNIRDNVSKVSDNIRDNVSKVSDNIRDNVNKVSDNIRDNVSKVADNIRDNVGKVSPLVKEFHRVQPMTSWDMNNISNDNVPVTRELSETHFEPKRPDSLPLGNRTDWIRQEEMMVVNNDDVNVDFKQPSLTSQPPLLHSTSQISGRESLPLPQLELFPSSRAAITNTSEMATDAPPSLQPVTIVKSEPGEEGAALRDVRQPSPKELFSPSKIRSPIRSETPETPEPPRSPTPEPRVINEKCAESKNALFMRRWWRGNHNSCSRSDLEFLPLPNSSLARKRRGEPMSAPNKNSSSSEKSKATSVIVKDERREERDSEKMRKSESSHELRTADAQVTSGFGAQLPSPYGERMTPRSQFMGHDPTPALRQLSAYARPHALAASLMQQQQQQQQQQESMRSASAFPYSNLPQALLEPYYRYCNMYPPGSRERLELELEREKLEREIRERELRERSLLELDKHPELDLKPGPASFERLLQSGISPLDPQWIELQRRFANGGGGPMSHMPGVYPPASITNDLIQRERERMERMAGIGAPSGPLTSVGHLGGGPLNSGDPAALERLTAERLLAAERYAMAAADPSLAMRMAAAAAAAASQHTHTHAHSHTHLHLHQPDSAFGQPSAATAGSYPGSSLPPGLAGLPPQSLPLLEMARQQELYRELLTRPPYSTDPVLAHQLSTHLAQQETLQRQMALERDRLGPGGGLLPHLPR